MRWALVLATFWAASETRLHAETSAERGYVVVVSKATQAEPAWRGVVEQLVKKHDAVVVAFEGDVKSTREELARRMPRWVCFVARPEEAGRQFVIDVHRLTRKLDDDPYTDCLWGILTGYTAADALRIASAEKPLVVRTGLSGTVKFPPELFHEAWLYSEQQAGRVRVKTPGGEVKDTTGPADSTQAIVNTLNAEHPDLLMTSGHATERDWQIGYAYPAGQLRCSEGQLFGRTLKGEKHSIDSPNAKIYLPTGNCLMGHVKDRDSMALAFMHSAGVNQMIGYVVSTWYGRGGWGTGDYFFDLPGRYSLAEAFYFNNQTLVHDLETRFPQGARAEFNDWNIETDPGLLPRLAKSLGYGGFNKNAQDHVGLLWDRDTVAFYGDPAWEARMEGRSLPMTTEWKSSDEELRWIIRCEKSCTPGRPLAAWLPRRASGLKVVVGANLKPLVTDDFIMLAGGQAFEAGRTYEVVLKK